MGTHSEGPTRTPCREGAVHAPLGLKVRTGNRLTLEVRMCFSGARLLASWDDASVFDGIIGAEQRVEVIVSDGEHHLTWTVVPSVAPYETRSRVLDEGAERFLDRRDSATGGLAPQWVLKVSAGTWPAQLA